MTSPAKQIVIDVLIETDTDVGQLSVTRGRGTARHWITVATELPVPGPIQEAITKALADKHLIGHYCDDYGTNNDYPCISFRAANGWSHH